jgi:hypothetical protein
MSFRESKELEDGEYGRGRRYRNGYSSDSDTGYRRRRDDERYEKRRRYIDTTLPPESTTIYLDICALDLFVVCNLL